MIVRQGDVLLLPVVVVESDMVPAPSDPRGLVLAEGESSGHYHAVFGPTVGLMRYRDGRAGSVLLVGEGGAEMRVVGGAIGGAARHVLVTLPCGQWEVRRQRAWTSGQYSATVGD